MANQRLLTSASPTVGLSGRAGQGRFGPHQIQVRRLLPTAKELRIGAEAARALRQPVAAQLAEVGAQQEFRCFIRPDADEPQQELARA